MDKKNKKSRGSLSSSSINSMSSNNVGYNSRFGGQMSTVNKPFIELKPISPNQKDSKSRIIET